MILAISDQATAALIGASAAVLGGVVVGMITYATERAKLRQARTDRAADALAEVAATYLTAEDQWSAWSEHIVRGRLSMTEAEWNAARQEYNARVTETRKALARLQLFTSPELNSWHRETFRPIAYEVREATDESIQARLGMTDRMQRAQSAYHQGYTELIDRLRAELAGAIS